MGRDDERRIDEGDTELIIVAQGQTLRTDVIKAKIEKQQLCPLCGICGVKDETVAHLLCGCSKMAQMQYKHRHGNVYRIVHWAIAKQNGLDVAEKWYEHKPEPVIENATEFLGLAGMKGGGGGGRIQKPPSKCCCHGNIRPHNQNSATSPNCQINLRKSPVIWKHQRPLSPSPPPPPQAE